MEEAPERTRSRGRGRRGGGRGRGRGSSRPGDRQQQRPVVPERGPQGRGFRGSRPPRGRGLPSRPPEQQIEEDANTKDEYDQPNEFSRRQVVSNWDRYKSEEKEPDDVGETLRGADFNVLLSSAGGIFGAFLNSHLWYGMASMYHPVLFGLKSIGLTGEDDEILVPSFTKVLDAPLLTLQSIFEQKGDSFAQFRFAEEKEWEIEVSSSKQISPLFVDCQSLAHSLQELPLYLRLNVEAELVQVNPPAEPPQIRLKSMDDGQSKFGQFRAHPIASSTNVGTIPVNPMLNPVTQVPENTAPASALQEPADHLDEELDFLLQLETPVNKNNISLKGVKDVEVLHDPETVNISTDSSGAEVIDNTNLQPTVTAKKLDPEEELEDWLDSMIS